jgi:hypothetical protein
MDDLGHPAYPLLLRYAQPELAVRAAYRYDPKLGINIITDADGNVYPAVEGPDAGILTKSQTIVQGED